MIQLLFLIFTDKFFYRQLKWFYKSRFMKAENINNLIMFLRKDKLDEYFSDDRHKKATNLEVFIAYTITALWQNNYTISSVYMRHFLQQHCIVIAFSDILLYTFFQVIDCLQNNFGGLPWQKKKEQL